jgi:uncharacterized protein
MELQGEAKLLRIFIGEADKLHHTALHEVIVKAARAGHLAGATAWRGFLGFGPTSKVRTAKVLDLSTDLPVIVEIVDEESKIDSFLPTLHDIFEQAGSGGLITVEKVHIIKYVHGANA